MISARQETKLLTPPRETPFHLNAWFLISKLDHYVQLLAEKNPAFRQFSAVVSPGQGLVELTFSADDSQETHAWKVVRNMLVMLAKVSNERNGITRYLDFSITQVVQLTKMLPLLKGVFPQEELNPLIEYFQGFFKERVELPAKNFSMEHQDYSGIPSPSAPIEADAVILGMRTKLVAIPTALKKLGLLPEAVLVKVDKILELVKDIVVGNPWEKILAILKLLHEALDHLWREKPILELKYDVSKPEAYNHQLSALNHLIRASYDLYEMLDIFEARSGMTGVFSKPLNDAVLSLAKFEIVFPENLPDSIKKELDSDFTKILEGLYKRKVRHMLPKASFKNFLYEKGVIHKTDKVFFTARSKAAQKRLTALEEEREKLKEKHFTPELLTFNALCKALYENQEIEEIEKLDLSKIFNEATKESLKKYLSEQGLSPEGLDFNSFWKALRTLDRHLLEDWIYLLWNITDHFGNMGNKARSLNNQIANTKEFIARFVGENAKVGENSKSILKNISLIFEKTDIRKEKVRDLLALFQDSVSEISDLYDLLEKGAANPDLERKIIEQYIDFMTICDHLSGEIPQTYLKLFHPDVQRISSYTETVFPKAIEALEKRRQQDETARKRGAKTDLIALLGSAKALGQNIASKKKTLAQLSILQKVNDVGWQWAGKIASAAFGISVAESVSLDTQLEYIIQEIKRLEKSIEELIALWDKNAGMQETDSKIQEITQLIFYIRSLGEDSKINKKLEKLWGNFMETLEAAAKSHPSLRQIMIDLALEPALEDTQWQKALNLVGDLPVSPNKVEVGISGMARSAIKMVHVGAGALISEIIDRIKEKPDGNPWKIIERTEGDEKNRLGGQAWKFSPTKEKDTTESALLRELLVFLQYLYQVTGSDFDLSKMKAILEKLSELFQRLRSAAMDPQTKAMLRRAVDLLKPMVSQISALSQDFNKGLGEMLEKLDDTQAPLEEKLLISALQTGIIPLPESMEESVSTAVPLLMSLAKSKKTIEANEKAMIAMEKDLWKEIPKVPYVLPKKYVPDFLRWPFAVVTVPLGAIGNFFAAPYNALVRFLNHRKIKTCAEAIEREKKEIEKILFVGVTPEEMIRKNETAIQVMAHHYRELFCKLDELSARYDIAGFKAMINTLADQVKKQIAKASEDPELLKKPFGMIDDHPFLVERLLKEKAILKDEEKKLFRLTEKGTEDLEHIRSMNSSKFMLANLGASIQKKEEIALSWLKRLNEDLTWLTSENKESVNIQIKESNIEEFEKLSLDFLAVYRQLEPVITEGNYAALKTEFNSLLFLLDSHASSDVVSRVRKLAHEIRSAETDRYYFPAELRPSVRVQVAAGARDEKQAGDGLVIPLAQNSQAFMPAPHHHHCAAEVKEAEGRLSLAP